MPLLLVPLEAIRRRLKALFMEVRAALSAVNSFLSERIDGVEVVQLFRHEAAAEEQFDRRDAVLTKLKTAEDWNAHAERIRESISAWTGAFPPRTPLNARVTGTVERGEYSLQKILFESRPGFLVSANLHLPKGHGGRRPLRTGRCRAGA